MSAFGKVAYYAGKCDIFTEIVSLILEKLNFRLKFVFLCLELLVTSMFGKKN